MPGTLAVAIWFQSGFGSGFGGLGLLLPVALIGMVLLTAVPQQRKQKKWNEMLSTLKPGDRVTTTGGIRGTILSVKEDALVLRLPPDNLKLEFAKNAIASVTTEDDIAK